MSLRPTSWNKLLISNGEKFASKENGINMADHIKTFFKILRRFDMKKSDLFLIDARSGNIPTASI